jgi:hypothetical protein
MIKINNQKINIEEIRKKGKTENQQETTKVKKNSKTIEKKIT